MTKLNDTQRSDELGQLVAEFKKDYEKASTDGNADVKFLEKILEEADTQLLKCAKGSPEYNELREIQHFVRLEIRLQYDRMLNASSHYKLALRMAMAVDKIVEEKVNPALAKEAERIAEEIRKTTNDQLAKKVSSLFSDKEHGDSDKGHEAMYW